MLNITVKFKSMSVEEYDPKTGVKVKIMFNDGVRDRVLMKSFAGGKAVDIADSVFKDVRDFETEQNQSDPFSDDPLDIVHVNIAEEDDVEKKINNFFEKIAAELKYVKGYHAGASYLGVVNKLKNVRYNF